MSAATRRQACRVIVMACLFAGGVAHARVDHPADEMDLLAQENKVYSASRYVQTLSQTPANVSIITRDDIVRFGYRSVADALKSLPGVYDAASQWPALGVSGIAVPGDFGSRILYLINGMPIYEPTYGGFFLDYLDIESIERIELVKGAGSALYGSGAVMGIVNLITHTAAEGDANHAALTVGSHRSAKAYLSGEQRTRTGSAFAAASASYSDGRDIYLPEFDKPGFNQARYHGVSSDNDRARSVRLFGRFTSGPAWLQALLVAGHKRDPLASYGSAFNAPLVLRESMAAMEAGIAHELDNGGQLTGRVFSFATTERGDYPYATAGRRGTPPRFINVSDLASRQLGGELRYDRFIGPNHHVLVGAELKHIRYSHQVGDQPGLTRSDVFSVNRSAGYTQWALFAQDEIRTGPGRLFLGARLDSYNGFSKGVTSRVSPRLAYVQDVAPAVTAKLVYGEAYRAPTVYESRYQDGLPAASTIWANGDLRPELARSFDAMLLGRTRGGLEWRSAFFMKNLQSTPVQVLTPTVGGVACTLGGQACIQYRNAEQDQKSVGMEFDLRQRQADGGDLYASAVLQRGRGEGGELTSSPRRQFKAGISRPLPWHGLNGAVEARYIGAVRGRIDATIALRDTVPSYVTVNTIVNAPRLGGGWSASAGIDNLLDRRYGTVASRELHPLLRVPADGRTGYLRLQRDF